MSGVSGRKGASCLEKVEEESVGNIDFVWLLTELVAFVELIR